jgi:hypothetical protein
MRTRGCRRRATGVPGTLFVASVQSVVTYPPVKARKGEALTTRKFMETSPEIPHALEC